MAQKWMKIIKNALIAKRLKHDSSISLSESLISAESDKSHDCQVNEDVPSQTQTISTFITSPPNNAQESEIEEFDAI